MTELPKQGALGLFGGFFIMPLYALIQVRSSATYRARIIAGNNIMNALFMVVGALAAAGLLSASLSIPRNPVPVIPMALSGLWGSIFSRAYGAVLSHPWKARLFMKVTLKIGEPVAPGKATLENLRDEVVRLRGEEK